MSFKDKLTNVKLAESKAFDFEIKEEDVILASAGEYPTMAFSYRVQNYQAQSMRNLAVVCLLGRAIGYRPLLNHLQSLWRPAGTFQLVNLENNLYLVKFTDPSDYSHAVIGHPWVIYGHYLTLQPWTASFSIDNERLTSVVA